MKTGSPEQKQQGGQPATFTLPQLVQDACGHANADSRSLPRLSGKDLAQSRFSDSPKDSIVASARKNLL
jgi:hypothetical protein